MDRELLAQILEGSGHDPHLSWIGGPNKFADPKKQAEARSGNTPMGDWFGANVDPRVGQAVSSIDRGAGAVVDTAKHVAMQPVRAGEALAQAVENPSLANAGSAAEQMALSVGLVYPPAAALAATGRAVHDVGKAALVEGVPGLTSTAQAGPVDDFRAEYQKMNPYPQEVSREEYIRRAGDAAAKPFNDANAPTNGTAARKAAETKAAQDYQLEAADITNKRKTWDRSFEDAWKKKNDAETALESRPFREKNPLWSNALMSSGLAVPAALGFRGGMRDAGRVSREAGRLDEATAAEGAARKAFAEGSGDVQDYFRAQQAVKSQHDAFKAAEAGKSDIAGPIAGGGIAGVGAATPELIDYSQMPDTPAGKNARDQLFSAPFWGSKAALMATGAGSYEGGKLAGKLVGKAPTPDQSRALMLKQENWPKSADDLAAWENSATKAGGDAQARLSDARELRQRGGAAQQLNDEATRLEQEALRGIDPASLRGRAQEALNERLARQIEGPTPQQGQLPPPALAENPPLPPPSAQGNNATTAVRNQAAEVEHAPVGDWMKNWSDPGRGYAKEILESGNELTRGRGGNMTGKVLREEISDRLPKGAKAPSEAEARDRSRMLLDDMAKLQAQGMTQQQAFSKLVSDPKYTRFALPFAVGAAAAPTYRDRLADQIDQ